MIEIKNRWTGAVIRTVDADTLRGADLRDADLRDADLRDADLRGADLRGADLGGAKLGGGIPIVENLHTRMLSAIETPGGSLDMGAWHNRACSTTHCRAGWAIHLAGEPGYALEKSLGPEVAGAMIHLASTPELEGKVPNFYDSNDRALADIRRVAALEAARK